MECFYLAHVYEEIQGRNPVKHNSVIANDVSWTFKAMKLLGGPTSMKKYIATMVLFSLIITTFIVTRNKRSFVNDYGPYEANIGKLWLKFS